MNSILKKLNAKPTPKGVKKWAFFNRMRGKSDFKHNQLVSDGTSYCTPWIIGNIRALDEYANKVYCYTTIALESYATEVFSLCEKYRCSGKPISIHPESILRSQIGQTSVRSEIRIRLNEILEFINSVDVSLQLHLERAENEVFRHISSYWNGILSEAEDLSLPANPNFNRLDVSGKSAYSAHLQDIRTHIATALNNSEEV